MQNESTNTKQTEITHFNKALFKAKKIKKIILIMKKNLPPSAIAKEIEVSRVCQVPHSVLPPKLLEGGGIFSRDG